MDKRKKKKKKKKNRKISEPRRQKTEQYQRE